MDTISYQTSAILQTASQMLTNANNAITEYEAAWSQIETCISTFPWPMQDALFRLIEHYNRRFLASCQWQIDMANVLTKAVSQMGDTDTALSKAFEGWTGK